MTEWIIAHPWMTFFLALTAIEAVAKIVGAVCQTIIAAHGSQQPERMDLSGKGEGT